MKSQGKHIEKKRRTKRKIDAHHADVSALATGATSMLVASSLYLGVNAPHAEAHETTTDEHDSTHNLLLNSNKEATSDAPETQTSPKHTPLHADKSAPNVISASAPLEDSAHKKALTPLAQKKESASGASDTGVEPSPNNENAIEHAQERSQESASGVRTKRSLASLRKQQEEDRDFDLKDLELHKVQGAKEFNSEEFKLQQAKNSAIAFLHFALSWSRNPKLTVIDETAGNTEATDEAIGQNAILGIRKARDHDEIRSWLDYVFRHKRGMYIVPENPSDSPKHGDVFDLYKPGTLLYGTTYKKPLPHRPLDYKVPEVKNINATVYVSNKPIKDNQGKLVGYRWYVRFNKNHDLHRSGHYYFTVPKGQTIVSSRDGSAFTDSTFKVTSKNVTQSGLQSKTYSGYGIDNLFANIKKQDKDLISSMVSGTAEGPNTYLNDNNKPYVYNENNVWWSKNDNTTGFAHTLKDIIYKHYWEETSKEQFDEAGFTNGKDGIKMGPFVDNLYKYKFDFKNQTASEYQCIDFAQLIQENTGVCFCLMRIVKIQLCMSSPTIRVLTIPTHQMRITPIMRQDIAHTRSY